MSTPAILSAEGIFLTVTLFTACSTIAFSSFPTSNYGYNMIKVVLSDEITLAIVAYTFSTLVLLPLRLALSGFFFFLF